MGSLKSEIANSLYSEKAYNLPDVCARFGLQEGSEEEAYSSKIKYVMKRLGSLASDKVVQVGLQVVEEYPNDKLQFELEQTGALGRTISHITRNKLLGVLDGIDIGGEAGLPQVLARHWPHISSEPSIYNFERTLLDDIWQHAVRNYDWSNKDVLEKIGFISSSQKRIFAFIEGILEPTLREDAERTNVADSINRVLEKDGFSMRVESELSGYGIYKVVGIRFKSTAPVSSAVSDALKSFDEEGVHSAWTKALKRQQDDPDGAITSSRTLLESVCKHIIEDFGETYGKSDSLPALYKKVSNLLNLAPEQHAEQSFKSILGGCNTVVNGLATLRNSYGDSHGYGKQHVKPSSRHAELSVNLSGAMALFLVSTWKKVKSTSAG